jgi:two-component system response regulator AlgR
MKILVVDDEPLARTRLRAQVGDLSLGEVVGEASNGVEAIERACELAPDVVLLDIRMPIMDGLEAARHLARLPRPPAVIFATAFDDHALAAFESCAVDYILKPIRMERLQQALQRAQVLARGRADQIYKEGAGAQARTHLSAMQKGELVLIPIIDIRYLRADQKYTVAGVPGAEILIDESLRALEEEFPQRFLRVHRNALVALPYVISLEREDDRPSIRLQGVDANVAVSRRLLAQVKKRLRGAG